MAALLQFDMASQLEANVRLGCLKGTHNAIHLLLHHAICECNKISGTKKLTVIVAARSLFAAVGMLECFKIDPAELLGICERNGKES